MYTITPRLHLGQSDQIGESEEPAKQTFEKSLVRINAVLSADKVGERVDTHNAPLCVCVCIYIYICTYMGAGLVLFCPVHSVWTSSHTQTV